MRVIRELGLELQVTFNKGAVMVLPSGVNKGVALAHVAKLLGIAREAVVTVGDGESDHSLLDAAGVAVHSAVPSLVERTDIALERGAGAGIVKLVARLLTEPGVPAPSRPNGPNPAKV